MHHFLTNCRLNPALAPAAMMKGGAHGSPGLPVRSPVEESESESGAGRESAPALLGVAWLAAVFQKRQSNVQLTTPVQSTEAGLAGLAGLTVLLRALLNRVVMPSFPPGCDIVPALTPIPLITHHHLATVVLEMPFRCSTAVSSPTAQRMVIGGRGLHLGNAQCPVGWDFSCH